MVWMTGGNGNGWLTLKGNILKPFTHTSAYGFSPQNSTTASLHACEMTPTWGLVTSHMITNRGLVKWLHIPIMEYQAVTKKKPQKTKRRRESYLVISGSCQEKLSEKSKQHVWAASRCKIVSAPPAVWLGPWARPEASVGAGRGHRHHIPLRAFLFWFLNHVNVLPVQKIK